jgi:hypothetical protein
LEIGHQTTQGVDKRPRGAGDLPRPLDGRLTIVRAQNQERILAKERISSHVLAAFDALQQKRVVGVFGDLEERRRA